jgi:hypothetical protein
MYWNRSAADIAAAWQGEIDSKLEMAAPALLLTGAPDTLLTNAASLLALQQSTLQRDDIATPLLVSGGNSALWLGLLLAPQPTGTTLHAPPPTVIYGGADEATYLSSVGLAAAMAAPFPAAHLASGATPLEMGMHVAPRLQPAVATPWEMLPLVEVGEQPVVNSSAVAAESNDPTRDWVVWGVMMLALSLVLSAILI